MNKTNLEKNTLDLAYKRNLQLLNILLISGIGAVFAFLGSLILNPEKFTYYVYIIILVGLFIYITYKRIDENLKKISRKIRNLI